MAKDDEARFQGIPNEALGKVILRTMYDAAALQAAGLPLPKFRETKADRTNLSGPEEFAIPNAAFGEYLRVSAEITQMAADLRRTKTPKMEP